MPPKYHTTTTPVPNRFPLVTRSGVIAWEEGCLKCARCVKKDCVYLVYQKRNLDSRQMLDSLDSACMDCFRCVQNCPARLIQKGVNPVYRSIGDHYWTPEILSSLWFQAETGKIPVSGAGYGGPFAGPGFDAMWTDMSEIVRPTRDGIHGREYISTSVDLGRKLMALEFGANGSVVSGVPPLVEIPTPLIFDLLPFSPPKERILNGLLRAASGLETFTVVRESDWSPSYEEYVRRTVFLLDRGGAVAKELIDKLRMVEIPDEADVMKWQAALKRVKPELVIAIRMPLSPVSGSRIEELTKAGIEVVHLVANQFGMEEAKEPLFVKDRLKEIHLSLVDRGLRDQITIIAGGGIAMAEHMAKLIICGADAVSCDIPLLVAMECRVCRRCAQGISCPVELDQVDPAWARGRITNLISGWHNQLLEIMGAMGMREVRRLRGEMGRAMFFEDLEKEFSALGRRQKRIEG
ncbi:MAG TPA: glutamate synthase-related protein [Thermodesulfobacteriota bacterium]|nr:glutamate synthase-related protein [Thermodesulfobacteriota bacterium]